ncbi:hypothetical protein B0H14DRAFT_3140444 [Mycena olivaceomarginata]|nr:hypothetical protein B0H14DRAFT_3140444 [Mycena olivaceomarginata]
MQLLAHSVFVSKSDSIHVPCSCEFNSSTSDPQARVYVRLCLGIASVGGGEARIENPFLPDRTGTTPFPPSCLLFSFGLELDTVDNCPYSNPQTSRTFPTRLARTSPSGRAFSSTSISTGIAEVPIDWEILAKGTTSVSRETSADQTKVGPHRSSTVLLDPYHTEECTETSADIADLGLVNQVYFRGGEFNITTGDYWQLEAQIRELSISLPRSSLQTRKDYTPGLVGSFNYPVGRRRLPLIRIPIHTARAFSGTILPRRASEGTPAFSSAGFGCYSLSLEYGPGVGDVCGPGPLSSSQSAHPQTDAQPRRLKRAPESPHRAQDQIRQCSASLTRSSPSSPHLRPFSLPLLVPPLLHTIGGGTHNHIRAHEDRRHERAKAHTDRHALRRCRGAEAEWERTAWEEKP